jgi:hypothetical protein
MIRAKEHRQLHALSKLLTYFAIGSLLYLAIGLKDIENYLKGWQFSVTMFLAGSIFGYTLYIILLFFIPFGKNYKPAKGIRLATPLVFAFAFIFFGAGSILNESTGSSKECKQYIIQSKGEGQRSYFILIRNGDKIERLNFGRAFNKKHQAGDTIKLCIITGRLGFKYYKIKNSA